MAVELTKRLVCDMCGSAEGVQRWRLAKAKDGRRVSPDLCEVCGKPFEEVMAKMPRGKRGQTKARPVVTEDQVRAARRRPKKSS